MSQSIRNEWIQLITDRVNKLLNILRETVTFKKYRDVVKAEVLTKYNALYIWGDYKVKTQERDELYKKYDKASHEVDSLRSQVNKLIPLSTNTCMSLESRLEELTGDELLRNKEFLATSVGKEYKTLREALDNVRVRLLLANTPTVLNREAVKILEEANIKLKDLAD